MEKITDYTIEELFEQAANDPSWESDEDMRVKLINGLKANLRCVS